MTSTETPDRVARERDALSEQLFGSLLSAMEWLTVDLGVRVGLYAALREAGSTVEVLPVTNDLWRFYRLEA